MKKLLLVLLVVTLASFLFVGCLPVTPAEGEGEGEGEGEITVKIADSVVLDGKTYVSCGTHTITITFPAPVVGYVDAYVSCCYGDYSEDEVYKGKNGGGVVLFPNADKTVWTGSGYFGDNCGGWTACCASYVEVWAGECEDEACIWFPVIVDCDDPFAEIEITVDDCLCAGCEITFDSTTVTDPCYPDVTCCDDYCSGLASWSIVLYDATPDPFDICCDISVCAEPIGTCSGTECPILCTTDCLTADDYIAVVTLVDEVGNETEYYAWISLTGDGLTEDCAIEVYEGTWTGVAGECVEWDDVTTDTIGECGLINNGQNSRHRIININKRGT